MSPPTASSSTGISNQDLSPGIVGNLSGSAVVSTTRVSVGGGRVLVAAPPTVTPPGNPVQYSCSVSPLPSYCDSLVNVASVDGSSLGGNTFVAGSGNETFGDTGFSATDAIDFSNVATSGTTPLTVNASGAPFNGVANDTGTVGSVTYDFTRGGSNFTTFTGSSNGNTTFLAGGVPNYTFTGNSTATDSIDFSSVRSGVTVDLSAGPTPSPPVKNVRLAAGQDSIVGLTNVVGSSAGNNRFIAGPSATYNFTGNGNGNTFDGGAPPGVGQTPGIDVFSSNGSNNTFKAGTGSATFNDAGSNNKIDFRGLPGSVTVDVAGVQVGGTLNNTATSDASTYTFTTFGTAPTTFEGAAGGTTFYAGTAADTFNGHGGAATPDTLSFAFTSSAGPLAVCVAAGTGCSAPGQAVLGSVKEPFSGIVTFNGLANGNTTFVANGNGGYTFAATGTNNAADFSADPNPINADLGMGTVQVNSATCTPLSNCDTISGVTSVLGSRGGHNTFVAGSSNETFGDTGSAPGTGQDTVDFSNVVTSSSTPLTVNVSGTPVSGVGTNNAGVGPVVYSFSNRGTNFTNFTGSRYGFTKFVAAGASGGYSFCATGPAPTCGTVPVPGDTADFSANLSGVTVNVSPSTENGLATGMASVGAATPDTVIGMTTIIGSPFGANTFFGGLTGTTFTSTAVNNTVSYVGLGALAPRSAGVNVDLTGNHVRLLCLAPCNPATAPALPNQTDTFSFSSGGGLTVQGSPGSDTFVIGTTSVNLSGGGGKDTLDLSQIPASGTTGATVSLAGPIGTVTGPSIGGVTFSANCPSSMASDLCVSTVNGSRHDDTIAPSATSLGVGNFLTVTGNGGNDTLDLSAVPTVAVITMPLGSAKGTVAAKPAGATAITFTGIPNVVGTSGTTTGGDTFTVGSGTGGFTENQQPGTLDLSKVGTATAGVTVSVGQSGGVSAGTVTSSPTLGVNDTFTNFATFTGTIGPDTFKQSGGGTYAFNGGPGSNILDLSNAPTGVMVNLTAPSPGCSSGANDGTAIGSGVNDTFSCIMQVITAGTQIFTASPGQTATLNGGGSGTLELIGDPNGKGATVTLPVNGGTGSVRGDGYNFDFTGMSTIDGTPNNDLFIPGTGNVTIMGGGGADGVSYKGAPGPVVANLSNSSYTIPTGFAGAGTSVAPFTATGGYGGTIIMAGISNLIGTTRFNDILVGGSGQGSLISGGTGNDRFVLSGGDTFVSGGTGNATTLDMSLLPGTVTYNLGNPAPQNIGLGSGTLTVVPGSIHTVIASAGGSQLSAGDGNITLMGGPGNDWLAAGTGNQTLIGGGGSDTLVAGVGNDTLQGGAQPVTFVAGQGTDTLTSTGNGNTLSYATATSGVQVNLSSGLFIVPPTEPMGGTVLQAMSATGGAGATVNLAQANITTVVGSAQPDILVTGGSGDVIFGGGGNDLLVIAGGNNTLNAGTGSVTRFLFEGAGSNVINGGGKATVDFSPAPAGVTVNLQSGNAVGGFGGSQSLTGVLNAIGTNFSDVLIGGPPGGTLIGLNASTNGGDLLRAGPIGGDTLISGGTGNDTFCAETGCGGNTPSGGNNTMVGGSGNDTFFVRNGQFDNVDGGGGLNQAHADPFDNLTNIQTILP
ncbi:MAG: hypothetical protein M3063_06125 [Actinomycetota bacterium]|nr:hypothetical protein [Actinomycetota bacterium]